MAKIAIRTSQTCSTPYLAGGTRKRKKTINPKQAARTCMHVEKIMTSHLPSHLYQHPHHDPTRCKRTPPTPSPGALPPPVPSKGPRSPASRALPRFAGLLLLNRRNFPPLLLPCVSRPPSHLNVCRLVLPVVTKASRADGHATDRLARRTKACGRNLGGTLAFLLPRLRSCAALAPGGIAVLPWRDGLTTLHPVPLSLKRRYR